MNKKLQIILFNLIIFLVIIIGIIILCSSIIEPFSDKFDAFCKSQIGGISKCNTLTQNNCNKTSCCVWLNDDKIDNKCVKGNVNGPTFNTDKNGKTVKSSYYFMNKCYGNEC